MNELQRKLLVQLESFELQPLVISAIADMTEYSRGFWSEGVDRLQHLAAVQSIWNTLLYDAVALSVPELMLQAAQAKKAEAVSAQRQLAYCYRLLQTRLFRAVEELNAEVAAVLIIRCPLALFSFSEIVPFAPTDASWERYISFLKSHCRSHTLAREELIQLLRSPALDLIESAWLVEEQQHDRHVLRSAAENLERYIIEQYQLRDDQYVPRVEGGFVYPVPFAARQMYSLVDIHALESSKAFFARVAESMEAEILVPPPSVESLEFIELRSPYELLVHVADAEAIPASARREAIAREIEDSAIDDARLLFGIAAAERTQSEASWIRDRIIKVQDEAVLKRLEVHRRRELLQRELAALESDLAPGLRFDEYLENHFRDMLSEFCSALERRYVSSEARETSIAAFSLAQELAATINLEALFPEQPRYKYIGSGTLMFDAVSQARSAELCRVLNECFSSEILPRCAEIESVRQIPFATFAVSALFSAISFRLVAQEAQPTLRPDLEYHAFERLFAGHWVHCDRDSHFIKLLRLARPALFFSVEEFGDPVRDRNQATDSFFSTCHEILVSDMFSGDLVARLEGLSLATTAPYVDFYKSKQYSLLATVDEWFHFSVEQTLLFPVAVRRVLLETVLTDLCEEFHGTEETPSWFVDSFLHYLQRSQVPSWLALLQEREEHLRGPLEDELQRAYERKQHSISSRLGLSDSTIAAFKQYVDIRARLAEYAPRRKQTNSVRGRIDVP